jgi:hypothetical protein
MSDEMTTVLLLLGLAAIAIVKFVHMRRMSRHIVFRPGDLVRVSTAFGYRERVGTVLAHYSELGVRMGQVQLDDGSLARVSGDRLARFIAGEWLVPGKRVRVGNWFGGVVEGELIRPSRLLNGKRGWLVRFDRPAGGLRRMRVAVTALRPASGVSDVDVVSGGS